MSLSAVERLDLTRIFILKELAPYARSSRHGTMGPRNTHYYTSNKTFFFNSDTWLISLRKIYQQQNLELFNDYVIEVRV